MDPLGWISKDKDYNCSYTEWGLGKIWSKTYSEKGVRRSLSQKNLTSINFVNVYIVLKHVF